MAHMASSPGSTAAHVQRYESLQAALDLIAQGITLMDGELRLVAWNQRFLELLDFPVEMAYIGAPFESFMRYNANRGEYGPGDVEQQVSERVAAAHALTAHEFERTRPNGAVIHVRGVPVPQHGFITLYSDVTEQRRQERQTREHNQLLEAQVQRRTQALTQANLQLRQALERNEAITDSLARSEARIRLITDSIPALVAYFGNDRRYHYVNSGYHEWFGLDTNNTAAINARHFLGSETYLGIRPHVMRAIQGEPVTFEYEVQTVHRGQRIARTCLIPELTPDGHFVGCFELTFDVTDERLAHTRMASAQKMEALGQLTGGLAHDFNNILTVVQGNLSALMAKPELKGYVGEYLQPALEAAQRGSDLIRGLLAFSRKHPLSTQVQDLNQCLLATAKWLRSALPDTLVLDTQTLESPVWVRVDTHQLRDALLNLAFNARDATDGRGRVSLRCTLANLDVATASALNVTPGAYAQICVQDDGCGMDAATLNRVFEPFFSTKPVGKGSGLGMPMVYGFVQQSAGAIELRSVPGEGTSVAIFLPLHAPSLSGVVAQPEALEGATGEASGSAQRLALLVEDDVSVRQWLRRELLELGYSVIEAFSGDEALPLIENTADIGLLLTDVAMPGEIDGIALARHAKRMTDIPKIVLMSGNVSGRQLPAGFPLLHKPFTRAELLGALTDAA